MPQTKTKSGLSGIKYRQTCCDFHISTSENQQFVHPRLTHKNCTLKDLSIPQVTLFLYLKEMIVQEKLQFENHNRTCTLHGTKDELIPFEDSEEVVAAFKASGVVHQFVIGEGLSHGYSFPRNDPGYEKYLHPAFLWFKKYLSK